VSEYSLPFKGFVALAFAVMHARACPAATVAQVSSL
jgi:hypothetical protein